MTVVGSTVRSAAAHLDAAAAALARWRDPREQLLRRRRAARAATGGLAATTGLLGTATAGLAASPLTEWLAAGTGGLTAVVAVPTVVVALRWRRLRRTPLPEPRVAPPRPPARGSCAHAPLLRLARAERSLDELLGLLARDPAVPVGEVDEARAAARGAAVALRREADGLAALERARDSSPAAAAELTGAVGAALLRLREGVAAHDGLVAAAARAVARLSGPGRAAADLTDAVERVDALTAALTELAGLHAAPREARNGNHQP